VPTAAAPAQVVLVVDQLDQYLDLSSVELVDLGFNNVETFVPAGQQQFAGSAVVATDPNPVRITAGLNPDTGQITWEMASMDPVTGELPEDPFAGFLPPNNTNAHDGEGFVQFRVNPKPGLPSGTVISNMARITFDVNQPIDTPWVINIIDSAAPVSSVSALPAQEYL